MDNPKTAKDQPVVPAASAAAAEAPESPASRQRKRSSQQATTSGDPFTTPGAKKYKASPDDALINLCSLLECSPPRTRQGEVAKSDDVFKRIAADKFEKYMSRAQMPRATTKAKDQALILVCLYGRDYYADDEVKRKSMVKTLIDTRHPAYARACRLFRLKGDASGESLGLAKDMKQFVENYGLGEGGFGYNVFQNVPMVRRVQQSGSCFLHAPLVEAAYKEFMDKPGKGGMPQMVDMCKYIRHGFDDDSLTRFLVEDKGGNSPAHLSILTSQSRQTTCENTRELFLVEGEDDANKPQANPSCELVSLLKDFGPLLVSQFPSEKRFIDLAQSTGPYAEEPPFLNGTCTISGSCLWHAMVLVGIRYVNNGWRVLVQNWWPTMPFVEMSEEYLVSSKALLIYLTKPVHTPQQFERCNAVYAEADLDKSEEKSDAVFESYWQHTGSYCCCDSL